MSQVMRKSRINILNSPETTRSIWCASSIARHHYFLICRIDVDLPNGSTLCQQSLPKAGLNILFDTARYISSPIFRILFQREAFDRASRNRDLWAYVAPATNLFKISGQLQFGDPAHIRVRKRVEWNDRSDSGY